MTIHSRSLAHPSEGLRFRRRVSWRVVHALASDLTFHQNLPLHQDPLELTSWPGGIEDATAGYKGEFKPSVLDMIHWSEGLFGFVASLQPLLDTLESFARSPALVSDNTPTQTTSTFDGVLSISSLQTAYRTGLSPITVIRMVFDRIENYKKVDPAVWIHLEEEASALERAKKLLSDWPDRSRLPPLFGVPFSVKDSFDIAGLPTTTACPSLTRIPLKSAPAYGLLLEQGAIFIGKTNLDQLATGLTGCRSPFGIPRSVLHLDYISGGSSSGSCVSVGAGLVTFSLGTDTAGSGRIPAGFNGVVGYKPTRGLISAQGVTPACLSLDCVAIIAGNVSDARTVWDLCAEHDEEDPYAKVTAPIQRHINSTGPQAKAFYFGIPPLEALAICNPAYRRQFDKSVQSLHAMGGLLRPVDWSSFEKAGKLLYEGSFVSERLASLPDNWFEKNREYLHPAIREVFENVITRQSTAIQAYRDLQAKALYTRKAEKTFAYGASGIDVLVVPTTPTHWTVKEVLADPIATNTVLGEFSHFGNVLDLCAVAVPASTCRVSELQDKPDAEGVLPFSVTFLGGSRMDGETLEIARRFEEHISQTA